MDPRKDSLVLGDLGDLSVHVLHRVVTEGSRVILGRLAMALTDEHKLGTLVLNYHFCVSRAEDTKAKLTVTDWKDDNDPGGQKLLFGLFQVQPYFTEWLALGAITWGATFARWSRFDVSQTLLP